MSYQLKLNCPICEFPRLTNLSRHLTTVHGVNGQERKCLLAKASFSVLSTQPDQPQPSIPEAHSTPSQFGNSLPKTSPLPEQKKLPNPIPANSTSDENEDQLLIPCPYDSRIRYERIWGTNVPLMDYDIFKLHHPFSMLVAGSRGAGKSEFVKQLLSLKQFIMTNPQERIVWFYGRHQPDLFCSLTQEIPWIEFYEGLPTNNEVMFDRSKRNICIIDNLMQSASGNQLVENLFTNGRHLNLSVVFVCQNLFYAGKKCRTISLNSTHIVIFRNPRDQTQIRHLACQMFPSKPKFLQAAYADATKDLYRYLFSDFHPNSPEFARVRGNIFPYDLLDDPCCLYLPKDMQI